MSDYSVISAVSSTLKELLTQSITNSSDAQLNGVPIVLNSPKEVQIAGQSLGISVWLYKVSRMAEMLNEPPERKGANQVARPYLPVVLYYLMTPVASDPATRHTLLGRILQVFQDYSILRGAILQGTLQGTDEQLRVNLEALTLDELSQVWEALDEPYQLSVTYLVQVAKIDSDREPVKTTPVLERDTSYARVLSVT